MNSLFSQLNPTKQLPANIKQMAQMFKSLNNPQAIIQKALNENPQLKAVLDAANGDPEKAFRDMAAQMNVDPDEIISLLK